MAAALVGALAMFFLDPERGRYRRNVTRDRFAGSARDASDELERAGKRVAAEAYGAKQKLTHLNSEEPPENDAVLKHKVMSELFRDPDIPKGDINIDAVDGVVHLRGQVDRPDQINDIEERVRRINGVREVENLLHQPGTPARRPG
ncbi:MAG TPA: BON domain-containing protein [Candidatus Limnocylindria bacterium]|nr:BON domain-containing protein [Candidatus Limnocylindria bacterium]